MEKNAKSRRLKPSVITVPESAQNARMDKDALTLRHVMLLARKYQQMRLTPATGPLNHQHANKIQKESWTRNHVLINARELPSVSVTLKQECVSHVTKLTPNVNSPWTTAKKQTKRNISANSRLSQAYSE